MRVLKRKMIYILIMLIIMNILSVEAAEDQVRQVEYLDRGIYAICTNTGVYLSWRMLGTEENDICFDIYRNGELIENNFDGTNYTDREGAANDRYGIVVHGKLLSERDTVTVTDAPCIDIPLEKPSGGVTRDGETYTYEIQNASVADVDNDGSYEYIINWDPDNRKDNSESGYTGNVYIDCYEQDGTRLWRIDMGKNIRAGSHYTQFIAYDFDGDGKAELAMRTAPGSKDSTGAYVSEKAGSIDGKELTWSDEYTGETFDDESDLRDASGRIKKGPDWLTMFNGETGEAMRTVNFYPQRGDVNTWGDDYGNRSERYLGGVAYLDGAAPSLIMSRGYYGRAAMAAYAWDGENFTMLWSRDDTYKDKNLYGNGNHQLSVCDADSDGRDEIVFGSTVVDDDGSILNSTDHGHGDALHVSDFDNDGQQEIFQVHEESYSMYGVEIRKADNARIVASKGADSDVGRGVIGNLDDSIGTSEWFSSADENIYDMERNIVGKVTNRVNPSFLVWWDGDPDREILYRNLALDYDVRGSAENRLEQFSDVSIVNKDAPVLSADLFGDWREEICYPSADNTRLRIFMTTIPTEYKLPTFMHDTQYREAVAAQNVGYNQPPHPKFYIGTASLSENGKTFVPEAGFDEVEMVMTADEPMQRIKVSEAVWGKDSLSLCIQADGGRADISMFLVVYDSKGAVSMVSCRKEVVTGEGDFYFPFEAGADTVKLFIWDEEQRPYVRALSR